jgi:hypothetical protein
MAKKRFSKTAALIAEQRACARGANLEGHLRQSERPCWNCLPCAWSYTADELVSMIAQSRQVERDKYLRSKYGVSQDTFDRLLAAQGNGCACCYTKTPGTHGWHVDHDHRTNLIRGILCGNCNTGIGMLGDDLVGVERAVAYLQRHHERGGLKRDMRSPLRTFDPKISAVMKTGFSLLDKQLPASRLVSILRIEPHHAADLVETWKKRRSVHEAPPEHSLILLKDRPYIFGCGCVCGEVSRYCSQDDPDTAKMHLNEVNEHVATMGTQAPM